MHNTKDFQSRLRILRYIFLGAFIVFSVRLFDLQVLQHDSYNAEAKRQHEKRSILPARRGKILVRKNRLSQEVTPIATNNTLKKLFIDPMILHYPEYDPNLPLDSQTKGDPTKAAQILAPLLIHAHCDKIEGCDIKTDPATWTPDEQQRISLYQRELTKIFTELERRRVLLSTDLTEEQIGRIQALAIPGVWVEGQNLIVNPTQVRSAGNTAQDLAPILDAKEQDLRPLISRRPKRYVEITDKIVPEVSRAILDLKQDPDSRLILRGVALQDEYWRYYPEREFASQLVGFVNHEGVGQYGVEGRFDDLLKGKEGVILGATNTRGQRIIGKGGDIIHARDGDDLVLTIDRVIQGEVEKILNEDIARFNADFAQIVVVEPATGKILAMANAPSFNPNEFGKVHERFEISEETILEEQESELYNPRIPTIKTEDASYRYFNTWGPQVYRNKIITDTYEPGSVMKAMTIAAALNADEITPKTTYEDTGPLEVGEFTINNSDSVYAGVTSMISVLNRSLNTGIAFVTKKMGNKLLYEYLTKFGFGEFTDIQLDGEAQGKLEHWTDWDESELITRGYGQGITATPLQVVMAFASLANGGYLMKPMLVEEVRSPDDSVKQFQPEVVRRVISEETYHTIKSMLKNTVSNGTGKAARVKGYSIMGKTGTSQSYRNGKAQTDLGTTIASFAGFGPINEPAFVILVKYDFPKTSPWGSETAAVTFGRVAEFLFKYLEIPPEQ